MSVGGNMGSRAGEEMIQWKGAELKAREVIQENHTSSSYTNNYTNNFIFPYFCGCRRIT